MAGGDCIDDADVNTLGGTVKAPSTLGTFLRSFRWGHVRQLDRVSRELWPGPGPLGPTRRPSNSTLRAYLAKEGARDHGYTGKRGYQWPSPPHRRRADVPAARSSCGRRWDGCATPGPTDDSRYGPTAGSTLMAWRLPQDGCPIRQQARACAIYERYQRMPGHSWTAPPMSETTCTPFQSEPDAAPVRLIVRRVAQALFASYSYHGPGRGDARTRRHAEIERPSETSSTVWG